MKTTKRNIKEMGEQLWGYYLGSNVYDYENIIYYLRHKDNIDKIDQYPKAKELYQVIKNIDYKYADDRQLAYSCGVYGNNGQLHIIELKDKNYNTIKVIFTYYC